MTSDRAYDIMVATYCRLGVPLSMEKTERTVTVTDFLGIVVDAEAQCLRYPADKTAEVLAELRRLQRGATRTKLQLFSLLGKLVFADIVFPLARPFLSPSCTFCPPRSRMTTITSSFRAAPTATSRTGLTC